MDRQKEEKKLLVLKNLKNIHRKKVLIALKLWSCLGQHYEKQRFLRILNMFILIISLMLQQFADYFNRFYQLVLKEIISDPIIHSQWLYFLSMFKGSVLEKDRVDLYLSILANQRGKKDVKAKDSQLSNTQNKQRPDSKVKLMSSGQSQNQFPQIKLEKRFSENYKHHRQSHFKTIKDIKVPHQQSFTLKKVVSLDQQDSGRFGLMNEQDSTGRKAKRDVMYALPTNCTPNSYAYLRPKTSEKTIQYKESGQKACQLKDNKAKEKYKKLCQLSKRLVSAFEGGKIRV